MQFDDVKRFIEAECQQYGVTFFQSDSHVVTFNGVESNGYFDEGTCTLAVSTNPHSLEVMVHEYSHMLQCVFKDKEWTDLEGNGQIWEWIEGTDFPDDVVDNSFRAYYNVELHCEAHAVALHKEWNTGINVKEYIQKANAYTMFYLFMRENRVWYVAGKEPYALESVWRNMPTSFSFNRLECYTEVAHLFEQCI